MNPEAANNDRFGGSVSLDASRMAVGAYLDDSLAIDTGRVYIFNASSGVLERTLDNPSPDDGDYFGWVVILAGDNILVTAPYDDTTRSNSGRAYLFEISTGVLLHTFAHPSLQVEDLFGLAAASRGTDFIISAPFDNDGGANVGRAFLFSGTTGELLFQIPAVEKDENDNFGLAVAAVGDNILVGAPGDNVGTTLLAGSVYLFDGSNGALIHTIPNPSPGLLDGFGNALAGLGSTHFVVGVSKDDLGASDAGSAFIFDVATGALVTTIPNPEPTAGDLFASSMSSRNSTLVISSPNDDFGATDAGSVYVFNADPLVPGFGSLLKTIRNPLASNGDLFGSALSMFDESVVIGSPFDDVGANNAGVAFLFGTMECPPATLTPSPTPTHSPTSSPSPSVSPSPTATPSPTPTGSPTSSPTESPTPSPTPFNNSSIVGHSIPLVLPVAHTFPVRVTVQNLGNTAWSNQTGFELRVTTDTCGLVSGGFAPLPDGIFEPSALIEFFLELFGTDPGECNLGFRMYQSTDTHFFGEQIEFDLTVVPPVNDAQILNHTIPPIMAPEQSLFVGISVRNTGNTAWTSASNHFLAIADGSCMIAEGNRVPLRGNDVVLPGQSYQFIVGLTAPTDEALCALDFQMIEEFVEFFGQTLTAFVNIESSPNSARTWLIYH